MGSPQQDSGKPSLIVNTRNRPDALARSLPSFIANLDDLAEIIVIDQSSDDQTMSFVNRYRGEYAALRYARSDRRGTSNAKNLGISMACSQLLAFTDDDCLLPPGWAREIVKQLRSERVGAFFGSVIAEPFDWRVGHTPDLPVVSAATLTLANQARLPQVMGANMAFKRETIADIGGFDPFMGPGSPLENGEDIDAAYRVLLQGYEVVVSPSPAVTHFGFRTFASGEWRDALRGGHVGLGAHMGKHIRCGDLRATITCLESLYDSAQLVWRNWLNGQRPLGFSRSVYTVVGIVRSLRYGVDRDLRLFRARGAARRSTAPARDSCVETTTIAR